MMGVGFYSHMVESLLSIQTVPSLIPDQGLCIFQLLNKTVKNYVTGTLFISASLIQFVFYAPLVYGVETD